MAGQRAIGKELMRLKSLSYNSLFLGNIFQNQIQDTVWSYPKKGKAMRGVCLILLTIMGTIALAGWGSLQSKSADGGWAHRGWPL